jgi:acetyltransferase-like isoleucine patch superfamily enzyme
VNYWAEFKRRFSVDGGYAFLDAAGTVFEGAARAVRSTMQRPRFGRLGRGSVVGKARLLGNPRFVFIGDGVTIRSNARLEAIRHYKGRMLEPRLEIGDRTFIEFDAHIACAKSITIERDVLIAAGAFISDHNHSLPAGGAHPLDGALETKPVRIGAGSWLGERCTILPGVTLGKRCIVGAGAVVTRSFQDDSVIAGVPARLLRSREAPPPPQS